MNRFFATDPQILATIHCGGQRLSRNSQAPMPSYLEAPSSSSERSQLDAQSAQMTVPRWKRVS